MLLIIVITCVTVIVRRKFLEGYTVNSAGAGEGVVRREGTYLFTFCLVRLDFFPYKLILSL